MEKSHPDTEDNLQLDLVQPIKPAPYSWVGHLRTPESRTPSIAPKLAFNDDVVCGYKYSPLQGWFSSILQTDDRLALAFASSIYDSFLLLP